MDQWVAQVKGRVRRHDETLRAYCYSKIKICGRNPAAELTEPEIVRYLPLGMRNTQAESLILAARPRTLEDFFIKIIEWEGFALNREVEPVERFAAKRVAILSPGPGEFSSHSPTRGKDDSLAQHTCRPEEDEQRPSRQVTTTSPRNPYASQRLHSS